MKKAISFSLALLLTVSICGCSNDKNTVSSDIIETVYEEVVIDNTASASTVTSSSDSATSDTASVDDSSSSVEQNSSISSQTAIDYNTTVEIDICDDVVRGYLDAKEAYNQFFWLKTYEGLRFDHQNIKLDWEIDYSNQYYTVYFSENIDFSNAFVTKTNSTREIKNTILVPGKTYYWKVVGSSSSNTIAGGKIKVKDAPVRWIYIDGVRNFRDMGGWKTESGKTVKYEMLYRGPQLNTEKDGAIVATTKNDGLETFNKLGIKTEFDLRSDENVHIQAEGINCNYVLLDNHNGYGGIFTYKTTVKNYKLIFEYLSDESNYPIYAHCQGGADRTGTYAFLLNGLLGVSYEDLIKDFEMTSFAGQKRWRSAGGDNNFNLNEDLVDGTLTVGWRALYNGMMEYGAQNGCTTLQQSIEHWFINYVGVPQSQIDSFKNIMLE